MFDVASSLQSALQYTNAALRDAAGATARAQSTGGSTDATMAQVAQHALFTEALLNATHARLEEIKSVTK